MSRKSPEKRVFDRHGFAQVVHLLDEHGCAFLELPCIDLSSSGVALATTLPFPLGMRLFLRLALPSPLSLQGEVVRTIDHSTLKNLQQIGIGVQFLYLSAEALLALEGYKNA